MKFDEFCIRRDRIQWVDAQKSDERIDVRPILYDEIFLKDDKKAGEEI